MRLLRAAVVGSLLVLAGSSMRVAAAQQPPVGPDDTDPNALTEFQSALDPYGTWVNDGTYGTVWIPNVTEVGQDFEPYVSAGSWVSEDGGYVWQSDYPWGDVVFHHGRWVSILSRGWGWIPGHAYADAWVDWSADDGSGYVGWAPTPPAWIWAGGVAVTLGFVPFVPFVYCPPHELLFPPHARHVIVGPQAAEIHAHARPFAVPGHVYGPNYAGPHNVHPSYARPNPVTPFVPPVHAPHTYVGPRAYVAPRPEVAPHPFVAPRIAPPPAFHGPAMQMPAQRAAPFMRHR